MAELQMLLSEEIPNGRKSLIESHNNLQKVASYCKQKYAEETDKKSALEETKNYTTQSLASVAYQINTLASNMLQMLDIQAAQLSSMDSAINNISQHLAYQRIADSDDRVYHLNTYKSLTVDIHKEKIARREIGLLTTSKVTTRTHQIVAPTNPERPVKYVRKPVDFTELDDVGHGVKLNAQPNTGTARRSSAASIKKSPASSADGGSKRDSLKSAVSGYGTLRAVKAPTVPPDYSQSNRRLPNMFHARSSSNGSSDSAKQPASLSHSYRMGPGVPPPPPPGVAPPPSPGSEMPPLPPPPDVAGFPAPADPGIPPPPPPITSPLVKAPPPPPVLPSAFSTSDSSGGYSTPVVRVDGKAPTVGGSAQSYATSSVVDLPPPPSSNMLFSNSHPSGVSGRNPHLPMTGFTARMTGTDMGIPPPPPLLGANVSSTPTMENDVLPPPPPPMSPGGLPPMDGVTMEPDWAPKTYLEKMVIIYDYSAENADELDLKEDQLVYVVRKNDDGWYEGVVDGVTGLFPGNYAESVSS